MIAAFFAVISCEKDSNENQETKTEATVPFEKKFLNANELPADIQEYINTDDAKKSSKFSNVESINDPIFMMYDIVSMTDDKNITNYSISFFYPDTPENVYYNLVINVLPKGVTNKYIFKYTCNPGDFENFKAHSFDFKYFVGTTEISQVAYNNTGKFTSKSSAGDDPCPKIFIPSPSDPQSNSGVGDVNGGGSGGGGTPASGGFNTSVPGYNSPASSGGYKGGGNGSSGHDHSSCYGSNGQYWYYAGDVRPPHPHTSKSAGPCPEVTPPSGYVPVNTMPLIKTLGTQLNLSKNQIIFLRDRPDTMNTLGSYLTSNNFSDESKSFCTWAINYLMQNPNVTITQFKNWFMGTSEGQDGDYDAAYWDDPNLNFPKQNLPTWAQFNSAFPRNSDPLYDTPEKMYNSIGGDVAKLYTGPTTNTCAVRLSKALNYSGVTIPNISGQTFRGADNKYYFKAAYQINLWMRQTFGTNPASNTSPQTPFNENHFQYTQSQAGVHGVNLPTLLNGKKGIYSIYSSNFRWATGHADLLNDNATCGNACHFYDAPIHRLDIWILN